MFTGYDAAMSVSDSPILFLDSGIGGLPYLDWVAGSRPDLPLVYVADTRNFPYGELKADRLRNVVVDAAEKAFLRFQPRLMVLACNTASVAALEHVRAAVSCPVVGTVPAVKPAASLETDKPIGILATEGTVNSSYLDDLIETFAPGRRVVRVAAGDIVRYVEEKYSGEADSEARRVIRPAVKKLQSEDAGSVVLGCTHFLHITELIGDMLGADVPLVDSCEGVGRRILALAGEPPSGYSSSLAVPVWEPVREPGQKIFVVTQGGLRDERYRFFSAFHHLNWMGEF